jgi:hypothetical protein
MYIHNKNQDGKTNPYFSGVRVFYDFKNAFPSSGKSKSERKICNCA